MLLENTQKILEIFYKEFNRPAYIIICKIMFHYFDNDNIQKVMLNFVQKFIPL